MLQFARAWGAFIASGVMCSGCVETYLLIGRGAQGQASLAVTFDSARTVVLLSNPSPTDTTRRLLTGVLAISGKRWIHRADTLVIAPDYITRLEKLSAHESRVVRSNVTDLGDLVLVQLDAGTHETTLRGELHPSPKAVPYIVLLVDVATACIYFTRVRW
jgi:hypothetical protein